MPRTRSFWFAVFAIGVVSGIAGVSALSQQRATFFAGEHKTALKELDVAKESEAKLRSLIRDTVKKNQELAVDLDDSRSKANQLAVTLAQQVELGDKDSIPNAINKL